MRVVRWLRGIVVASVLVKIAIWGTWWTAAVRAEPESAAAHRGAEALAQAGLPPSLVEQSRGFRELLAAVAERQAALEAKEKALAEREAGLAQLEKAVEEQVARLEALTGTAASAVPPARAGKSGAGPRDGGSGRTAPDDERPAAEIVRIYEAMKPEEAAPILDRLDDETLRVILGRMKERQIGAILASMNRDRAVAFTKLLAATAPRDSGGWQVPPTR